VRRPAPRPLGATLPAALAAVRPPTLLARVQAAWPEVAGTALASVTTPVSERDGVVTVACESAAWAQELEMLQRDLAERLSQLLGSGPAGSPRRLRFTVGSGTNGP
jgi:predicted nucleic acid-binding Zn ribbon protein